MQLDQLILFQTIVEKGGLAAAGRELGLSPTTVSDRLARLETFYGVTLLNRTTRSISLSEEGRVLFEGAKQVIAEAQDLDDRVRFGATTLSGPIRLSAPLGLGRSIIEPVIDQFVQDHPKIRVELILSDGYVNLVDEGIDLAVRFGDLVDSSLRQKRLGENHRYVVAAPDYLAEYGSPKQPEDLRDHNCLLMRFGPHLDQHWAFQDQGRDVKVQVTGNRIANDGRLVHDWALKGYGIALKSMWDVEADLNKGLLVRLLADFAPAPSTVQILFAPARTTPRRVRALAQKIETAFTHNKKTKSL